VWCGYGENTCEERGLDVEEEEGEECGGAHQIKDGGSPVKG